MKDTAAIPFHFHILSMPVLSPDVFSSKQTCSENRYYMYIINYAMAFNKFYFLKNSKFFHNMIRLAGKFPPEKQLINTQERNSCRQSIICPLFPFLSTLHTVSQQAAMNASS